MTPRRAMIALLVVAAAPLGAPATTVSPGTAAHPAESTRLDGDELLDAGLTRLSDILLLAEGWGVSSIDNYHWWAAPPGTGSSVRSAWRLFIDGRPVDADGFGTVSLARLPLTIERIQSVDFVRSPGLRHGRYVPDGAVLITTRRPPAGWSGRIRYANGAETGDPGPLEFTPMRTPNAERLGAESSGSMAWTGRGLSIEASILLQRHFAGDERIIDRYNAVSDDRPRVQENVAPSLRLRGRAGTVAWDAYAEHARVLHAPFVPGVGREIPADHRALSIGASAEKRSPSGVGLGLRVDHTRNDPRSRANVLALDPGPRRLRSAADAWARKRWSGREFSGGAGWERIREEFDRDVARAWARGDSGPGKWRAAGEFSVERDSFDAAVAGGVELERSVGSRSEVRLSAVRAERRAVEDPTAWVRRGAAAAGATVAAGAEPFAPARQSRFALTWRSRPSRGTVEAGAFVTRREERTADIRYFHDVADETVAAALPGVPFTHSWHSGAFVALEPRLPGGRLRVSWYWQEPVAGGRVARDDASTEPRHRFRATCHLRGARNALSLWTMLRWTGSARWVAYDGVEAASGGRYTERIPSRWEADLSVRKSFLGRRAHGGFTFRNAFDNEVRLHPIGAGWNLSFYVHADLALGLRESQRR